MSVFFVNICPAIPEEWDAIWKECDYSTYFHSREWAEIWNAYTKGYLHPEPILISFSDGKKALLPLSSQKTYRGWGVDYISSPAGTFGGWISSDKLTVAHGILLVDYLKKEMGNLVWRINPYDELVCKVGVKVTENDETHSLNLTDGFEAVYKGWTKGHRSAARKARKEGVTVGIATTLDDWYSYYAVYEDSLRRWGNSASCIYRWEIFGEMFRRGSPYIKLWLASYRGRLIAGALCFYAKNHIVYWHGAALEDYFYLRPVHLLLYETINDACENGYSWFDFNPSGEHEGVKAFKKSFGAKPLQCPMITFETVSTKVLKRISGAKKKIW